MKRTVVATLSALALCGCGESADVGAGLDLALRIEGAQLARGPLGGDVGGPALTFIDLRRLVVVAGDGGVVLSGRAARGAYAIHLGLANDGGHWIVPAGVEDAVVAGELSWSARVAFAALAPLGEATLLAQAVDGAGRGGGLRRTTLTVASGAPDGALVIALRWDRQVDLDLHVTDPEGVSIGPKNINTYTPPAPGQPPDAPDAHTRGGVIDIDSNANCLIDGRRREHAVWTVAPRGGRYVVGVDLAATCGVHGPTAYVIEAVRGGERIAETRGVLYPIDARHSAQGGAAAPLRALEFSF